MKRSVFFILFCFICFFVGAWSLESPNGKISVDINNIENQVFYNISYKGDLIVENSIIGVQSEISDFHTIDNISLIKKLKNQDVSYRQLVGKKSLRNNSFNMLKLKCSKGNYFYYVEFRAYNDGVTFRYSFNENRNLKSDYLTIKKEYSSFNFKLSKKAWMQAYHKAMIGRPSYERYFSEVSIGTNANKFSSSDGWCFPALFEFENNVFLLLSESDLDKNYCGCKLNENADNGCYKIAFPSKNENYGIGENLPCGRGDFTTPWRVLIIGSLKDVIESTLIDDSSSEFNKAEFGSTDWINPGRAVWDWAANLKTGNFEKQKLMIDKASEMGWKYCLVDANWNKWNKNNAFPLIKDLCNYAKSKNVNILLWYNSGGNHNKISEEPRNRMLDPKIRQKEMKTLKDLGVKGIKVDFFHSDKQVRIQQYIGILEDALKNNLLVNFHGCTIPRGWQRTYPNLMTMEAVKGGEWYGFSYTGGANAQENVYYSFTRNVIGSMDYTPVILENYMQAAGPSFSHALAQSVIFESGIQHFAGSITKAKRGYIPIFNKYPEIKLFMKSVSSTWDETIFIEGYPSSHIVLARRNNDNWFCAGMNGQKLSKQVLIPLNFLPNGKFKAIIIKDGINKKDFFIENKIVDKNSNIEIKMKAQGGFSIMFEKI